LRQLQSRLAGVHDVLHRAEPRAGLAVAELERHRRSHQLRVPPTNVAETLPCVVPVLPMICGPSRRHPLRGPTFRGNDA
jgi:hypothetical protein